MDKHLPNIRKVAAQAISISHGQCTDHARAAGDKSIAIANTVPRGHGLYPREMCLPRQHWSQCLSFRGRKWMRAVECDARTHQGPMALGIAIESCTIGRMNVAWPQAL